MIDSIEGRDRRLPEESIDPRRRTFYLPEGSASILADHLKKAVESTTRQPGHHPGPQRPAEAAGAAERRA